MRITGEVRPGRTRDLGKDWNQRSGKDDHVLCMLSLNLILEAMNKHHKGVNHICFLEKSYNFAAAEKTRPNETN